MQSLPQIRPTLGDLLLEQSRAAFNEKLHQKHCRARAGGNRCQSCMDHEAVWLAADRAVTAFMASVGVLP